MPTFSHYSFDFSEYFRNDNITVKCSDLIKRSEVSRMQYLTCSTSLKSLWHSFSYFCFGVRQIFDISFLFLWKLWIWTNSTCKEMQLIMSKNKKGSLLIKKCCLGFVRFTNLLQTLKSSLCKAKSVGLPWMIKQTLACLILKNGNEFTWNLPYFAVQGLVLSPLCGSSPCWDSWDWASHPHYITWAQSYSHHKCPSVWAANNQYLMTINKPLSRPVCNFA